MPLTIILMCVATCALQNVQGQTIVRFDDGQGTWLVADTYPQANEQVPDFVGTTTLMYFYAGDTLIDGAVWGRMYAASTTGDPPAPVAQGLTRQVDGFVLYMDGTGVIDTLYDFNLQVGDSMHYVSDLYDTYLTITTIDSVLVNTAYHKVFHFNDYTTSSESWLTDKWIEGIGSIHGPLAPRMPATLGFNQAFPDSTRLTCYSQDELTIWSHAGYPDCVVNIGLSIEGIEIGEPSELAWPNPFVDKVSVTGLEAGVWDYVVLDTQGRILLTGRATIIEQLRTIDLSTLPPGIHLLRMNGVRARTFRLLKI
jgi:hypothetical protein